jgi:hypothetical protein
VTLGAASGQSPDQELDLLDSSGVIQSTAIVAGVVWAQNSAQIKQMAAAQGLTVYVYPVSPGASVERNVDSLAAVNAWIAATAQTSRAGATLGPAAPAPTTSTDPTNTIVGIGVGLVGGGLVGAVFGGGKWALAGALLGAAGGAAVGSGMG